MVCNIVNGHHIVAPFADIPAKVVSAAVFNNFKAKNIMPFIVHKYSAGVVCAQQNIAEIFARNKMIKVKFHINKCFFAFFAEIHRIGHIRVNSVNTCIFQSNNAEHIFNREEHFKTKADLKFFLGIKNKIIAIKDFCVDKSKCTLYNKLYRRN